MTMVIHTTVAIELPYPRVSGNHSVRHTRSGGHYLTDEAREYHDAIAYAVRRRKAPAGAIRTEWLLAPPDLRARDHTNVLKVTEDALTRAGFWSDDSNKVIRSGDWAWAPVVKGGRIHLTVTPCDLS
jgi:crossover junction endodeoxyribonuclease RusA